MKKIVLASFIVLNILLAVDCRAQGQRIEPIGQSHTPLLKSTDYRPSAPAKHKFRLSKLVKHICLAPIEIPVHLFSGDGWGNYDSLGCWYPTPSVHSANYYGYSFGMNSSPFGYNYVY